MVKLLPDPCVCQMMPPSLSRTLCGSLDSEVLVGPTELLSTFIVDHEVFDDVQELLLSNIL